MRLLSGPALLLGLCLNGCQTGTLSSSLPLELDRRWWRDAGVGETYRLTAAAVLNGQRLAAETLVCGFHNPNEDGSGYWWIRPEFEELKGDPGFIYGKRYGASTFVRFDWKDGRRPQELQPTPFTKVMVLHAEGPDETRRSPLDRWLGLDEVARQVSLLGPDGSPQTTFDHLASDDPYRSIELLPEAGSLLVHHEGFDRVYDRTGQPISPEVPPLWAAMRNEPEPGQLPRPTGMVFGVPVDAARQRYWLLLDDGRIYPKPDDCLGLQPLFAVDEYRIKTWRGWLAWWQTPAGERAALLRPGDPTASFEKLMASRAQAMWTEWTTIYDKDGHRFLDIRRADPGSGLELVQEASVPLLDHPLATVEEGMKWIAEMQAQRNEEWRKFAEQMEREREAARVALQQWRAAEAKAELERNQALFDGAMQQGDQVFARVALLKLQTDPARWTAYVQRFGLDPGSANDSQSIGYSRASLGGTASSVLAAAVARAQEEARSRAATAEQQSDWDYFFRGSRAGSAPSSGIDPRLTPQGALDQLEATRQRNAEAWLRGAQNWGAR